ncbi:MAG: uroporphyrinogen decarboxylase family protein [Candidatus Omnitrophota bacterium]
MLDSKVSKRIDDALNFREPDRVPVCDFLHNKKAFYYFSHKNNPAVEDKVKAYHELGVDICWRFERREAHRFDKIWNYLKQYTSRKHHFHALSKDEIQKEFEDFQQQQKLFEPYTYLAMCAEGCLSVAYRSLGAENFCEKMYVEPIEIDRLIDIFAENLYVKANEFARRKLGKVFFINDDVGYEKGLIFSENFLQQHWFPRIKDAIVPLKQAGIKVVLHSEGDLRNIIDGLVEIGIDGIHPVDGLAGMNLGILKKLFAKSLLLFGNVCLSGQEEKDIIEQTKKCIQNAAFGGGYFIGTRDGMYDNIELPQIFTFFNTIRDFGSYPINT